MRSLLPDAAPAKAEPAPSEALWHEHGWALSGRFAAALVGAIVLASLLVNALS